MMVFFINLDTFVSISSIVNVIIEHEMHILVTYEVPIKFWVCLQLDKNSY